jgi:hypothetical protein
MPAFSLFLRHRWVDSDLSLSPAQILQTGHHAKGSAKVEVPSLQSDASPFAASRAKSQGAHLSQSDWEETRRAKETLVQQRPLMTSLGAKLGLV